jgi:16S rRNA G1207 methylase RsmC
MENVQKNHTSIDTTISHGDQEERAKRETILAILAAVAKTGRKDLVRLRLHAVLIRERGGSEIVVIGPSEQRISSLKSIAQVDTVGA